MKEIDENDKIVVTKGENFIKAGYIYSPYLPLTSYSHEEIMKYYETTYGRRL